MTDGKTVIVTHSSKFHADDVFAVATLLLLLGEENIEIIRSRDMEVIQKGDYVVDVGGIHDPVTHRFDHHQMGGAGVRPNGIPYAAFGLVWKEYGEKITGSIEAQERIDRRIVQPMDAHDNGMKIMDSRVQDVRSYDIGSLVSLFLPTWKEEEVSLDDTFVRLVSYAKEILGRIIAVTNTDIEGEKYVLAAYENAPDKRLIEVDERYPWEHVLAQFPEPLYVIYKKRIDENWSLKGIRSDNSSFELRKKLPEIWAGKHGTEFDSVTGISDGVFCHNARFLAVAKSRESIIKLAEIALNA